VSRAIHVGASAETLQILGFAIPSLILEWRLARADFPRIGLPEWRLAARWLGNAAIRCADDPGWKTGESGG
jgi:hypothetical protein